MSILKYEKVRLKDIATYINGYAFKPLEWSENGLPIIRIQNLTNSSNVVNYYDKKYDKKYEVNKGDILISWSASLGIYEWDSDKALLNQHIFKVIFDKKQIDKFFFKYIVNESIKEMKKHTHGSTMKHITKKDFDKIEIIYPPLEIQQEIVRKLNKSQELIDKRKQQIEKYDEFLQSLFLDMFGDPVNNPKNWNIKKLNDLGTLDRGTSKHRPRNATELLGGDYPLIQTGEVASSKLYITTYKQTYSEIGLKQSKLWTKGVLCITIAANIAKTSITAFDACFPDSIVGFLSNKETSNIFIHFWFKFFQELLEKNAPESAQKNINLKILRNLDVIVPPIKLQIKFAEIVEKTEKEQKKLEKNLTELENNFKNIMQSSFKNN